MKAIKIAIISKSDKIRDFFRLEALNFGFIIDCFEKIESGSDLSSYELAIIDIDSVSQKPLNSAKKEITISEFEREADITFPIHIYELQEIYRSLYEKDLPNTEKSEENGLKIYFFTERPNVISIKNKNYLLSEAEYSLLKLLCREYPSVVSREEISKNFSNSNSNISDVYICKLRKKLESALGQRLIYTIRSQGYKIVVDSEWR